MGTEIEPPEDAARLPRPAPLPIAPAETGDAVRGPDLAVLHRKAQAALAGALPPEERPRVVIRGLASSALVATDARAFVFKAGARAGLPFSARLKEFEFESVMRIDLRRAGDVDVVVIHAPLKISVCSSYWADSRDDPWRARNAIAVPRSSWEAVEAARELRSLLEAFRERRPAQPAREPSSDTAAPGLVERIAELEEARPRPEILPVRPAAPAERPSGPSTEDCPRCGTELDAGWQFCPRCGAPASMKRAGRLAQRRRRWHT